LGFAPADPGDKRTVRDTAVPIDLVVLAMVRAGASIEQAAVKTGLTLEEASECLERAARILDPERHAVLSHAS